jgi:hypothetical protein
MIARGRFQHLPRVRMIGTVIGAVQHAQLSRGHSSRLRLIDTPDIIDIGVSFFEYQRISIA